MRLGHEALWEGWGRGRSGGGAGADGSVRAVPQESGDDEYKGDQSDSDDEVDSDFDIDEGEEPASDQEDGEPKRKRRVVTKAYKVWPGLCFPWGFGGGEAPAPRRKGLDVWDKDPGILCATGLPVKGGYRCTRVTWMFEGGAAGKGVRPATAGRGSLGRLGVWTQQQSWGLASWVASLGGGGAWW